LHDWLKRQATINLVALPVDPIVSDQTTLDSLKALYNKWTWAIDFCFAQVKEGYIIEFSIEYSDSLSEAGRTFEEGIRKRMLEEIPLWIKMLLVEKTIMCMEPNRMVK
jgi:hypothetical protein